MNVTEHIGTHPQSFRYYIALLVSTFRTMLSMGMLVVGTGLVALAFAVFLDGFGLVDVGLGLSIGEVLGASIVIGVCGAFAFGVATEGRYGTAWLTARYPSLEVAIGRLVGGAVVVILLRWIADQVAPLVVDQSFPFVVAHEVISATAGSGFLAVIVGVPAVWLLRQALGRAGFDAAIELPAMYVIWALFALLAFSMPTV